MEKNFYSVSSNEETTVQNSYYANTPRISRDKRIKAISLFVPGAGPDLVNELLEYMDTRIRKIHCVVLDKRIEAVNSILSKYHVNCSKRAVILNEFAHIHIE